MSDAQMGATPALWQAVHGIENASSLDGTASTVQSVAATLERSGAAAALRGDWLGHSLHPLLTDLPLGCWTAATLLDVTALRRGDLAARRLVGLGILFAAPTAASGLVDYATVREPRARRVGAVHGIGNAVATLLYLVSWRSRRRGHHIRGMVMSTLGGLAAIATGYLGGHLSFVLGVGSGTRGRLPDDPVVKVPAHGEEAELAARDDAG